MNQLQRLRTHDLKVDTNASTISSKYLDIKSLPTWTRPSYPSSPSYVGSVGHLYGNVGKVIQPGRDHLVNKTGESTGNHMADLPAKYCRVPVIRWTHCGNYSCGITSTRPRPVSRVTLDIKSTSGFTWFNMLFRQHIVGLQVVNVHLLALGVVVSKTIHLFPHVIDHHISWPPKTLLILVEYQLTVPILRAPETNEENPCFRPCALMQISPTAQDALLLTSAANDDSGPKRRPHSRHFDWVLNTFNGGFCVHVKTWLQGGTPPVLFVGL